jgi:hypothetical protein
MARKIKDLTGERFGNLFVEKFNGIVNKKSQWICRCDCGNVKTIGFDSLRRGTKSCGCLRIKENKSRAIHNEWGKNTKEYRTWCKMKGRCNNKNNFSYHNYGGRGIRVCDRWEYSFINFLSDMGRAPSSKHTLERLDNNKGYSPGNCVWATIKEQQNNRRNNKIINYKGVKYTLSQVCQKYNLDYNVVKSRLNILSWSVDDAITKPISTKQK